jgi:Rad3-related DNA helicase
VQLIHTPQQLGLPEKFSAWRPAQLEALQWLLRSVKRVKALCAPTGFGKTAVYVAYALITKRPTCFVTDSRALQDQLMGDFASVGMVDIRGRRNYSCDMREDFTCDDGYAARCPYKGSVSCPASAAEMRAATSYLVVTNYDKWTSARRFGTGMQHFEQVVFDEGHKSPDALARAMQVKLHHKEIEDTLAIDFPSHGLTDEFVNWKPWAMLARETAEEETRAAKDRMDKDPRPSTVRHFSHMRNLTRRLSILATANPQNWIADEDDKHGYVFDPIRPGKYAEAAILLRVPSIVVISATLRPKTMFQLGVAKELFDFREFDSEFDPKRCPIYYIPTMRVDSRAEDLKRLWILHDQIAGRRTDRKGITHTVSYTRRDDVLAQSRFASRMLLNVKGEASTDMINQYRASGPGTILVSPSVSEGFDFPMTDCEWQFLCKIPFPNGHTKIHKARQDADPEHGAYLAINKMVQTFGRAMRRKEDRCENFIGDMHLDWFLPRYGHLAPRSFHGFFKKLTTLPPPAEKL